MSIVNYDTIVLHLYYTTFINDVNDFLAFPKKAVTVQPSAELLQKAPKPNIDIRLRCFHQSLCYFHIYFFYRLMLWNGTSEYLPAIIINGIIYGVNRYKLVKNSAL